MESYFTRGLVPYNPPHMYEVTLISTTVTCVTKGRLVVITLSHSVWFVVQVNKSLVHQQNPSRVTTAVFMA
ncbi:hypothetical protein JOB18_034814 [Solea senegalensis]|uniref:Uncharacterized protein n=1 Tax=Solea senegalensis TaxID=28829 RepID=A0AAV6QR53_SOLSE|nr:hypothetical protein JOB18_034814 [Solea senegalensis]